MFDLSKTYTKWSLERVSRHVAYWLFWWFFYTVINEGIFENGSYSAWFLFELHVLPLKLTITYFTIYFLFPRYAKSRRYTLFIIWILCLTLVGGIIFRAIDYYIISGNIISSETFLEKIDDTQFWSFHIAYKFLDLLFVVSLVLLIKFIQLQMQQERTNKELAKQKLEAELNYLKHQLQPHFLFNTMNNLYGMIITKDENAGEIVLKLSEILSYMLYNSSDREIALDKELESLSNYIELEKLRYGDELTVRYELSGSAENFSIAPFILISFVENAFKHGPKDELVESWININVKIENDILHFEVENSIHKESSVKVDRNDRIVSGIGLSNVEKRLQLIYGSSYDLNFTKGDTFKVELTIRKHELSHS